METNEETQVQTVTAERGLNKSGKWWKEPRTAKHSQICQSKPLKTSWQKKMDEKNKNKQVAAMQKEIRDRKAEERKAKAERAKEQEERRLANERRGEIVQVIKNTKKLKNIKKKHLRTIETRDTTDM